MREGELYMPPTYTKHVERDPKTGRFIKGTGNEKGYFQKLPEWKQEEIRQKARENAIRMHKEGKLKMSPPPRHSKEQTRQWLGRPVIAIDKNGKYIRFASTPDAAEYIVKKTYGTTDEEKVKTVTNNISVCCIRNKKSYKNYNEYSSCGYRCYRESDKELWLSKLGKEFNKKSKIKSNESSE